MVNMQKFANGTSVAREGTIGMPVRRARTSDHSDGKERSTVKQGSSNQAAPSSHESLDDNMGRCRIVRRTSIHQVTCPSDSFRRDGNGDTELLKMFSLHRLHGDRCPHATTLCRDEAPFNFHGSTRQPRRSSQEERVSCPWARPKHLQLSEA